MTQQITEDNFIETLMYNKFCTTGRYNSILGEDIFEAMTFTASKRGLNYRIRYYLKRTTQFIFNFFVFDKQTKIAQEFSCDNFDTFLSIIADFIDLKPLPEFDFKQYLMDKFEGEYVWISNNAIALYPHINSNPSGNCKVTISGINSSNDLLVDHTKLKPVDHTKENADILIQMAKLAGELK